MQQKSFVMMTVTHQHPRKVTVSVLPYLLEQLVQILMRFIFLSLMQGSVFWFYVFLSIMFRVGFLCILLQHCFFLSLSA